MVTNYGIKAAIEKGCKLSDICKSLNKVTDYR